MIKEDWVILGKVFGYLYGTLGIAVGMILLLTLVVGFSTPEDRFRQWCQNNNGILIEQRDSDLCVDAVDGRMIGGVRVP